jgi:hypothetical protein
VNIIIKKDIDEPKSDIEEQSRDIYNVWSENCTNFLKMCGDSQMKICKSWVESMEELSKNCKPGLRWNTPTLNPRANSSMRGR